MTKANFVKKAQKDYPEAGIAKGEPYWWWKFRFGPKHRSKVEPRRSQLTQSDYLAQVYALQDDVYLDGAETVDDVDSEREELKSRIDELRDTCQESLDNMPDDAIVMDPMMGIGTAGVAALQMGRRFYGSELSHRYFEVANRDLAAAASQAQLFATRIDDQDSGGQYALL